MNRTTRVLSEKDRLPDAWLTVLSGPMIQLLARNANRFRLRLTCDAVLEPPIEPHSGQEIILRIEQNEVGGHALTLNAAGITTRGDLVLNAAAGSVTVWRLLYDDESRLWDAVGVPDLSGVYATVGSVAAAVPPGVVWPYGGSAAPTGFLLCDGSAVSRATYAALFAVVSTTFGIGDGTTTFNVPDMRGRVPAGFLAADVDFGTLGADAGAKTVSAAGSVSAPAFAGDALSDHFHAAGSIFVDDHAPAATGDDSGGGTLVVALGSDNVAVHPHQHNTPTLTHTVSGDTTSVSAGTPSGTVSAPSFTGSPTSVLQPSLTMNYIIKT